MICWMKYYCSTNLLLYYGGLGTMKLIIKKYFFKFLLHELPIIPVF